MSPLVHNGKRNFVLAILAVIILLVTTNVAQAASEAEKQAAIDAGLAWLATQQQVDGSWWYGVAADPYADIGVTGAALLAFIEEGHTPGSGTAYSGNVANGLNYVLTYAQSYPIGVQPAGNPDTNGNGIGVKFSPVVGNDGRDIYQTGLAIIPIAAVGTPGAIVLVGPQVGRTYADVIQDTADYFAYAQNEATGAHPNARGGWRYFANSSAEQGSDNSTSQWPTIALLYAQAAGATVPGFVASELDIWANHIQNADGGSDYPDTKTWGSNVSRTGTLLAQQTFVGWLIGDPRVQAALTYLNTEWLTTANSTWNGNFGHPYAMWAAYRGLALTIGLDADQSVISNLHPDPGDIDNPDHGYNWWEDYCEWLVTNQNVDGSWNGYNQYWPGPLATAWYINILAATEIPPPVIEVSVDIKPQSCPNPFNLKSRGKLPVAVLGTEEFDVMTIDPETVGLSREGIEDIVKARRYAYEDVATPFEGELCDCHTLGPDGFLDLTLKFSRRELVEKLKLYEVAGQTVPLILTGNLVDEVGTPIKGQDCVRVKKKRKPRK